MALRPEKDWRRLFFYGMCMGAADIVPGVSGGTMALICGIYEELIASIKSLSTQGALSLFRLDFRRFNQSVKWKFLLTVITGIAFSLIVFSRAIHYMLGDPVWRTYLYALFFGMILSSIVVCSWRIPGWNRRLWWGVAAGASVSLLFTSFDSEPLMDHKIYAVQLAPDVRYNGEKELVNYNKESGRLVDLDAQTLSAMWSKGYLQEGAAVYKKGEPEPLRLENIVQTAQEHWFNPWLFFCGVLAVSAMLLPGISGSFLLMILGSYPIVIGALAELVEGWAGLTWDGEAFAILSNLALGIIFGALAFSRVVDWFLKKDHDLTLAVLIGFMIGSLRVVWPYRHYVWELDPLKLKNGPQLIAEGFYQPNMWNLFYWQSAFFFAIGAGLVFLIYALSQHAEKS